MKRLIFSCPLLGAAVLCFSQTKMTDRQFAGSVSIWKLSSQTGEALGRVYMVEDHTVELKLYPSPADFASKTLVVTGTYTSGNGKVAGKVLDSNCNQVGNPQDAYFKPNAYLRFGDGNVDFANVITCNAIPVYKVIDDSVLTTIVNSRTNQPIAWRFLVQKGWSKQYVHGGHDSVIVGRDLLLVDFDTALTLSEACRYVKGLERNTRYHDNAKNQDFVFSSWITAVLLNTEAFRPFLLHGVAVHGNFPLVQSNVIVIQ